MYRKCLGAFLTRTFLTPNKLCNIPFILSSHSSRWDRSFYGRKGLVGLLRRALFELLQVGLELRLLEAVVLLLLLQVRLARSRSVGAQHSISMFTAENCIKKNKLTRKCSRSRNKKLIHLRDNCILDLTQKTLASEC